MRRLPFTIGLLLILSLLVGCASSGSNRNSGYYHRTGSIHNDSYPWTYGYGHDYAYGRPMYY